MVGYLGKDRIVYWGPMGCLTGNYLLHDLPMARCEARKNMWRKRLIRPQKKTSFTQNKQSYTLIRLNFITPLSDTAHT